MIDEQQMSGPTVFAVHCDDSKLFAHVALLVALKRYRMETFDSTESFASKHSPLQRPGCMLSGLSLSDRNGVLFLKQHFEGTEAIPVIVLTDQDYIPIEIAPFTNTFLSLCSETSAPKELLEMIDQSLMLDCQTLELRRKVELFFDRMDQLTKRQILVMQLMLSGDPNKVIAAKLRVSDRTVELERAETMRIFQVRNAVSLAVLISESRAAIERVGDMGLLKSCQTKGTPSPGPHLFESTPSKSKELRDIGSIS